MNKLEFALKLELLALSLEDMQIAISNLADTIEKFGKEEKELYIHFAWQLDIDENDMTKCIKYISDGVGTRYYVESLRDIIYDVIEDINLNVDEGYYVLINPQDIAIFDNEEIGRFRTFVLKYIKEDPCPYWVDGEQYVSPKIVNEECFLVDDKRYNGTCSIKLPLEGSD